VRRDHYTTFGSETSPRAAAAWSFDGNKFRAAYGEAFRAPQIGELYLPFFGNPDLHAEHSRATELGYDHYFTRGAMLSVTAFHNNYRDLIVYDLVQSRFNNIGQARSRGVELAASDRRGPWLAGLSYTYLEAIDQSTGQQLPRRPKHSGSASLGYDAGTANLELVVLRTGSRPDVTDLFPFGTVTNKAYTTADFTVRWNHGAAQPYVKIENLTDTKYQEVFGYPSPKRRAVVGLRFTVAR
jgi:vitamin B12 transporter